jgi:hypothetical protein
MAQIPLVETQIREGQRLLDRLAREGVAVTAAAWVQEGESGDWYLYLATPLVTEAGGKKPAYRRVYAVIREMETEGDFGIDPFAVKVIGPQDPTARAMTLQRAGRPATTPTWFRGARLGELAVEAAYIYPVAANPEEAARSEER